jgi:hypothetical protein
MKSALRIALAVAFVLIAQQMVLGSSIITMPTADVAPPGVVNVAAYAVNFNELPPPPAAPSGMNVFIAYAGIAKNLELEANVYAQKDGFDTLTFFNLTYKVAEQTATMPQISVGVKNLLGEDLGNGDVAPNDDPTYFVALVKVLSGPAPGEPFKPVVRLHVGLGNNLHNGIFGGLQAMLTPQIGLALLSDAESTLISAAFKPSANSPTFKAGTLGDHTWMGIDYDLKF